MKNAPKNKRNRGEHKNDKTVTTIVGGSMVRAVCGQEFPDKNERVVVIRFSRSTTEDMKTHIKPSLKNNPDRIIIHASTNDLRSTQDPETIAESIIHVAKNSKNSKNEISISFITPRRNNLIGKGRQVNENFGKLCIKLNFTYTSHNNMWYSSEHCRQ